MELYAGDRVRVTDTTSLFYQRNGTIKMINPRKIENQGWEYVVEFSEGGEGTYFAKSLEKL